MARFSYGIQHVFIVIQWTMTHHWITMKTWRIPYENPAVRDSATSLFSFIFPQIFFIGFLNLILWVGGSPTREGPGYATAATSFAPSKSFYKIILRLCIFVPITMQGQVTFCLHPKRKTTDMWLQWLRHLATFCQSHASDVPIHNIIDSIDFNCLSLLHLHIYICFMSVLCVTTIQSR